MATSPTARVSPRRPCASTRRGADHAERTDGGQRRYHRDVLRRVSFIRVAQKVGLTLDEIAGARLAPRPRTPDRPTGTRPGSWRHPPRAADRAARTAPGRPRRRASGAGACRSASPRCSTRATCSGAQGPGPRRARPRRARAMTTPPRGCRKATPQALPRHTTSASSQPRDRQQGDEHHADRRRPAPAGEQGQADAHRSQHHEHRPGRRCRRCRGGMDSSAATAVPATTRQPTASAAFGADRHQRARRAPILSAYGDADPRPIAVMPRA